MNAEELEPEIEGQGESITLELRVLSGMHAGARATLQGDGYTLGARGDCDFVLCDDGVQPQHARLSRIEDGWQLDWVAQAGGERALAPVRLMPGRAVPLGPLVVAVDGVDAPWPTLEQLVMVPHATAPERALPAPAVHDTPPDAPLRCWRARTRALLARRASRAGTVAAACVSALAMVAWPMSLQDIAAARPAGGAKHEGDAVSPPATLRPDDAQKQAIDRVLATLGMTGRVQVEQAGATWLVRAGLMTDPESESLTAALSRLQPPPALRMTTEQDLRDEVADLLVRLAPEYRGSIRLRYLGEGRFRLEGRMARAAERDKLLRSLAEAVPQVRQWDNAVVTGDEMPDKLLAELRSRGSWEISSNRDQGALSMQVKLDQRDLGKWEQALLDASRVHEVPFRVQLELVHTAAAPAPRAVSAANATLPFELRGVVGGDMPFVVLPTGEKLVQGGTWQGWRLTSVSPGQVLFENGAQRAIVMR